MHGTLFKQNFKQVCEMQTCSEHLCAQSDVLGEQLSMFTGYQFGTHQQGLAFHDQVTRCKSHNRRQTIVSFRTCVLVFLDSANVHFVAMPPPWRNPRYCSPATALLQPCYSSQGLTATAQGYSPATALLQPNVTLSHCWRVFRAGV